MMVERMAAHSLTASGGKLSIERTTTVFARYILPTRKHFAIDLHSRAA
jgi:hypothetical protein